MLIDENEKMLLAAVLALGVPFSFEFLTPYTKSNGGSLSTGLVGCFFKVLLKVVSSL